MGEVPQERKKLYDYQEKALERIFARIHEFPTNYNLCFQLPTGGGKTEAYLAVMAFYMFHERLLMEGDGADEHVLADQAVD
jgi:CRISPR/Cas system-associated endonuclease/helicase Cas3